VSQSCHLFPGKRLWKIKSLFQKIKKSPFSNSYRKSEFRYLSWLGHFAWNESQLKKRSFQRLARVVELLWLMGCNFWWDSLSRRTSLVFPPSRGTFIQLSLIRERCWNSKNDAGRTTPTHTLTFFTCGVVYQAHSAVMCRCGVFLDVNVGVSDGCVSVTVAVQ
jgi:hypothetical protein